MTTWLEASEKVAEILQYDVRLHPERDDFERQFLREINKHFPNLSHVEANMAVYKAMALAFQSGFLNERRRHRWA